MQPGKYRIDSLQLYNTRINKAIIADVDIDLEKTKTGIKFRKSNLHIDNYDFAIEGFISSDNIYDLRITGNNIDISKIRNYLPDKYQEILRDMTSGGSLYSTAKSKGLMTRTTNPHTEVNFRLEKGNIAYGKSDLS